MTVLDTHVHVWDPQRLDYPWLAGLDELDRSFLPAEYRPQSGARAVFVQADPRPDQSLAEAQWVAALDWPERAGIVAGADLRAAGLGHHLDALADVPGVVGIRHNLQGEAVERFAEPALLLGLSCLVRRELTFDACIQHRQLDALVTLVREVPGLRVVLDHVGKPPVADGLSSDAGRRWAHGLQRFAQLPGAHVKLSGLPAETTDAEAYRAHVDDYLRFALDTFGPERSMIGSDWPVSARMGVGASARAWFERVRAATRLDDEEWRIVSQTTGARFYRLQGD